MFRSLDLGGWIWDLPQLICFGVKAMKNLSQIGFGLRTVLAYIPGGLQ